MNIASDEYPKETLALLKILEPADKDLDETKIQPVREAFARVHTRARRSIVDQPSHD